MIKYEENSSPFFTAHKNYCLQIENNLNVVNATCEGYCNSYGYEIDAKWQNASQTYHLHFEKHQSTQNGVIVPVDSVEYAGTTFIIKGLDISKKLIIKKSSLLRPFSSGALKALVPAPYFISGNVNNEGLSEFISKNKAGTLKLKNGQLTLKLHKAIQEPLELVDACKKLFN